MIKQKQAALLSSLASIFNNTICETYIWCNTVCDIFFFILFFFWTIQYVYTDIWCNTVWDIFYVVCITSLINTTSQKHIFFFINATSKNTIKKKHDETHTKQKQAALMSSLASIFNSTSTLFTMDIWRHWRPGFTLFFLFFFLFLFSFFCPFSIFNSTSTLFTMDIWRHGRPGFSPSFFFFSFLWKEIGRLLLLFAGASEDQMSTGKP